MFFFPALAAAAHRLLRARWSAGRAAGSNLRSQPFPHGGRRGQGDDTRKVSPRASHGTSFLLRERLGTSCPPGPSL